MNAFYRFLVVLSTGCLIAVTLYCFAYDVTHSTIVYHLGLISIGVTALLVFGFLLLRINDGSRVLRLVPDVRSSIGDAPCGLYLLPADATGSDSLGYQNYYNNGITQADHYIGLLFDNL